MSLTWEDKEIRFDIPFIEMRLKLGEKVIDKLDNIEDTKGNGGDRGRMIITNIRILWHSLSSPRINLSIGFNCIITINSKIVNSKLRGTSQALQLLTMSNKTRFEFIFTNLVPGNTRHFTSTMGVYKAFISSKLYRELRLRSGVIHNKQLKMLPQEQIVSNLNGVWNLSSDQGSLGTFIITNVRIVWFADMNEAFNISLPYLQISNIQIRDSKFGTALVITSTEQSGAYVLGFRLDPDEKLYKLYKELCSLHSVYATNPILGVEYQWCSSIIKQHEHIEYDDFVDINYVEEPKNELTNILTYYLANEYDDNDKNNYNIVPNYCPDLGLAIENIKKGFTIQKLWEVIPS